jgi:hypothetical protein
MLNLPKCARRIAPARFFIGVLHGELVLRKELDDAEPEKRRTSRRKY